MQFAMLPTASGYFNLTGNPSAADIIVLNGTTWTFVTALTTGNQILIGASVAATLVNALATLKASVDVNTSLFDYYSAGSYLYLESKLAGTAGNAYTTTKTSTNISVSGATLAGGLAAANDISVLMAATSTSSGAYVSQGAELETALDAAAFFDHNYGQNWYAMTILGASDADHQDVASFIQATTSKHIYGVSTQEAGVLSAVSTTDIAYLLKQLQLSRTAVQYSNSNPYSVCSLFARILTTNYLANNTVITLMYKQEPGIVPETLNVSQITALEGKNCNVFVAYNNDTAIIEKGVMANGTFIDIVTGTDWLALTIQTSVYNLLYTSTTKIPQTDPGNHLIATAIEDVCVQGVTNGLLAPGIWQSGGFGTLVQNAFLPKGFYVYAPPIATQNASDRAARKSVPLQVAAKLAGAIHTVDIIINVNR
jgi:hypothetical protein